MEKINNNKPIANPEDISQEVETHEPDNPQEEEPEARPEQEFKEFAELSFAGFNAKLGSCSLRSDQLISIIMQVYNDIKLNNGDKSKESYVG